MQICWKKFARYFDVEIREVPLRGDALGLLPADPATTAVELAHQLAFRHGLGNSLFASPLEPVTLTAVRALYRQARAGQVALIGTGIEFNKLVRGERKEERLGQDAEEDVPGL